MAGVCEGTNEPPGSLKANNQATKRNIEGGGFGPVLWIQFGVAQWSERLVRRTKDPEDGRASRRKLGSKSPTHWLRTREELFYIRRRESLKSYDAEIDRGEEKELARSLAEKKLPTEGYTERIGEREKSSGQKKISDDRRH
ncbi:hypothetical protein ANN_21694 [Periplaneta americana]|uniref:Uncharacterized protein n=1 Tax=Periplaneta americana TaxID=6978 RepID=A0ABQ8S6Z1_PERAM|nr:hypothetical protein ANN_21694 [Periplaneta americana]